MGIAIGIIILFAIVMSIVLWITQNEELAVCIILGLLTIACTIAFIYLVMIWFPRFQCEEKVRMSGNDCHWELFTGCQVKVNGKWIPYEKWRSFE